MRAASRATLCALALFAACGLAAAAEPETEPAEPRAVEQELTREQRREMKRLAREARVEAYLDKRERRIAEKEAKRHAKQAARQASKAQDPAAEAAAPAVAAVPPPAAPRKPSKAGRVERHRDTALPPRIARTHQSLWDSPFSDDPSVQRYLMLIEQGNATAQQLAAFANFLGQNGMIHPAIDYYGLALGLVPDDPLLWINVGTLHRQAGELKQAGRAYARALSIDPNDAYAHYNLGAVLDQEGDYEGAIEEYRLALLLDPDLGDPAVNPQAANNERLLAVRLMLYEQQVGSLGLPLLEVPGGHLEDSPPAPQTTPEQR